MSLRARSGGATVLAAGVVALSAVSVGSPAIGSPNPAPHHHCTFTATPFEPDFNGDCRSDLVVPIPGHGKGAGAIELRSGYSAKPWETLRQGRDGIPGPHRAGAGFGDSFAVTTLNDDAFSDLAVGIPNLTVGGVPEAGGIQILFGASKGLRAGPLITRASTGVPGEPTAGEHFGTSLMTYDAQSPAGDDETAMFIGAPGADVPDSTDQVVNGAGEVTELDYLVQKSMPTPRAMFTYYQGHGVDGVPVAGAHLGKAMGWVEYLPAAGAPDETVSGHAGAGFWGNLALPGSAFGANLDDFEMGSSVGGHLGASFEVGSLLDVERGLDMVGSPGATVAGHRGAGGVQLYRYKTFEPDSVPAGDPRLLTQNSKHVPGRPTNGGHFGAALTALVSSPGDPERLFIGAPGDGVAGHHDAGAVVEYSEVDKSYRLITQDHKHVPGNAQTGDHFGATLRMALLENRTGKAAIFEPTGIPGEDVRGKRNAGALELVQQHGKMTQTFLITHPHARAGDEYGG